MSEAFFSFCVMIEHIIKITTKKVNGKMCPGNILCCDMIPKVQSISFAKRYKVSQILKKYNAVTVKNKKISKQKMTLKNHIGTATSLKN